MKILLLSQSRGLGEDLKKFMEKQGDKVKMTEDKLLFSQVEYYNPELIVSYNYCHILPKSIFQYPKNGTVNLHISYLPYNRGASPNVWSHLEGAPSGVTIHQIDEGIDTGHIIAQKLVTFPHRPEPTLYTTFCLLHIEMIKLFKEYYKIIKTGNYSVYIQKEEKATFHKRKDLPNLPDGYGTSIWKLRYGSFDRGGGEI